MGDFNAKMGLQRSGESCIGPFDLDDRQNDTNSSETFQTELQNRFNALETTNNINQGTDDLVKTLYKAMTQRKENLS